LDASLNLTLACALEVEEKAARRAGAKVVRIGLGGTHVPLPDGRIVGFGLAGALVPGLAPGTVLSAKRIVGEVGETLWEGEPLAVAGARPAVICAAGCVVDEPGARAMLAAQSGAVAVDMESAVLARSGRLAGVVRAISDTPARPVGCLACASKPDGRVAWSQVVKALLIEPHRAIPAGVGSLRALSALKDAARALANGAP
jgi:hypothetical protein